MNSLFHLHFTATMNDKIMKYKNVILHTDRLRIIRIRGETHGTEINGVICDTVESLEPWIDWANVKPTVDVSGYYLLFFYSHISRQAGFSISRLIS